MHRILKPSNIGKRPLQIVRPHRTCAQDATTVAPDHANQNLFQFSHSSKEVAANIIPSQGQNSAPLPPKKISFSESRKSLTTEGEDGAQGRKVAKKVRASSAAKAVRQLGLEEVVGGYVEMLRGRGVVHMQHASVVVDASKFARLIAFVVTAYNTSENMLQFQQKLVRPEAKFTEFMRKTDFGKAPSIERLKFKKLLALTPKVLEYSIHNEDHSQARAQCEAVREQASALASEVKMLESQRRELQGEVGRRNNEFTLVNYQIEKLQYDFDQYIKREEYLKNVIAAREAVLADLEQRRYEIARVFEGAQMTHYRRCFEETRRGEEALFLLAEFLQCHPLGSRPYEPSKRALCNERLLEKELREVKRTLAASQSAADKENLLGAFLGRYQQEYRETIQELQGVIAEKTELIRQFTAAMQEWRERHVRRHGLLVALNDALLLQDVQAQQLRAHREDSGSRGEEALLIIDNVIKLLKVCQPLL